MRLGMVGLGRMGANMARRLIEHNLEVVVYDRDPELVAVASAEGGHGAKSLDDLVSQLDAPRVVWLMVPSGVPTQTSVEALTLLLDAGDTIVDGGNSHYRAAQEAGGRMRERGIAMVDAGVSGGVWGLKNGYCMMVGGDADAVSRLEPALAALAPPKGWARVGPSGAGHYAKMIHNGIEYGMLQAYAEGFALLDSAAELELDLHQLAALWNRGSVVRSWLLELAELALANPEQFGDIRGYVEDSGEGRWTVEEAVARSVSAPVITSSLFARFSSRDDERFAARIVAALRNQFGGHEFFTEAGAAEMAAQKSGEAEGIVTSPDGAASDRSSAVP